VFAVVEDQEDLAALATLPDPGDRVDLRLAEVEGGRDRRRHGCRLTDRRQLHDHHVTVTLDNGALRSPHRPPRLPGATGTGHGDQPVPIEQARNRGELLLPAHEPGQARSDVRTPPSRVDLDRSGWCRRRDVQAGIVAENRRLELTQRRTGLEAEFLGQDRVAVLEHPQRLGLATLPVQRQHQLTTQPFTGRVLGQGHLDVADETWEPAERLLGVDPVLYHRQAHLPQAGDVGLGELVVGEVHQRRASPQRLRLEESIHGLNEVASGHESAASAARRSSR
jgi:hypothetical protein